MEDFSASTSAFCGTVYGKDRTSAEEPLLHFPIRILNSVLRFQEALRELVEPPFEPIMDFSLYFISFKDYSHPYGNLLLPNE